MPITTRRRIRGIRDKIPGGFMLGRQGQGLGNVQLIPIQPEAGVNSDPGSPSGGGGGGPSGAPTSAEYLLHVADAALVNARVVDNSTTIAADWSVSGHVQFQRAALTGDITASANSNATTLATVNSNVGSFGSATKTVTFTVNGKGLITAASEQSIAILSTQVTDFTEAAQDATGAMAANSARVTLTYADATPSLTADLVADSITASYLHASATSVLFGRVTAAAGPGEEIVLDTDGTLAANSNIRVPSQKAVKTYVDTATGALHFRTALTADTTFYVRTDGSDSNDGSANDAAHAWLTIGHGQDYILGHYDFNGFTVTLQVQNGAYNETVAISRRVVGGTTSTFIINGDTTTPSNVTVTGLTASGTFQVSSSTVTIQGFKILTGGGATIGLYALSGASVSVNNLEFGACSVFIRADSNAQIVVGGDLSVSGGGSQLFATNSFGSIVLANRTVTFTTPVTITTIVIMNTGVINASGVTWTNGGTVTSTNRVLLNLGFLQLGAGTFTETSALPGTGTTEEIIDSLIQVANSNFRPRTIFQRTVNGNFIVTDLGRITDANKATTIVLTITPNSTTAFPVGTVLEFFQSGAGQLQIAAGAGVTLLSPPGDSLNSPGQYARGRAVKTATDTWIVSWTDGQVRPDVTNNYTVGYTTTGFSAGTKSSGTYTPAPADGNYQYCTNGGAFTLAAPSATGDYQILVEVTNNGSAGVITMTGFDSIAGDAWDTVNAHKFKVFISKVNSVVFATVVNMSYPTIGELTALTTSALIPNNCSKVVVRKMSLAANVQLVIANDAILRIL